MEPSEISVILSLARRGEADAVDQVFPLVYEQLRQTARRELRRWQPGETLNSAVLVNEAYLKLEPFDGRARAQEPALSKVERVERKMAQSSEGLRST